MKKVLFLILIFALSLGSLANTSQIILNVRSATTQVEQAESLFNSANIKEATVLVESLFPVLTETTELHSQIYEALKENSAAISTAKKERELTIEFAKLRDRITYLAGMISRKQGNNLEAVKHFVQVIQSQRGTELSRKAYNNLKEMGFSPQLSIEEQI